MIVARSCLVSRTCPNRLTPVHSQPARPRQVKTRQLALTRRRTSCNMEEAAGSIFVYGTLMAPEVTKLLIGRMPDTEPATLTGHRRYSVKGADYPAIIPSLEKDGRPADEVQGLLMKGLTHAELGIFDEYEDDDYHRAAVSVSTQDGAEHAAFVYVWNDNVRYKLDLSKEWDYELFRREKLPGYKEMVHIYADEMKKAVTDRLQ